MSNDEDVCCIAVSFHCTYYAEQDQAIAKYMVLIYILEIAKEREREREECPSAAAGCGETGEMRARWRTRESGRWEELLCSLVRPSVRPCLSLHSLTDRS